ncbi:MAG TPA: S-methyl-5-thioribose-1-phosphate isomerase [bacterium]|jgi:methylthioribose-1-phosphate isomerase|nr:S-methyl-5-thioribose-1-phosphate isomerase [bacterium]
MLRPLQWSKGTLKVLDQVKLPHSVSTVSTRGVKETGEAIRSMKVRGAPAIGVAAAYGMAQAVLASRAKDVNGLMRDMDKAGAYLKSTRPTAVNLAWAVDRMLKRARHGRDHKLPSLKALLVEEAQAIEREDVRLCDAIAAHGSALIRDNDQVLTHCNTGALATAGVGTALGCITAAFKQHKKIHVWVDETRPYLQGARLTALELKDARIPHTLVTDNSAAALMAAGKVNLVIVGADRITAQGDVANKIGTYGLAVLAKHHGLPFYVAAPSSTVDLDLRQGSDIPIEERSAEEVLFVQGKSIAPKGTKALHLAFDVTPHSLISAIITEKGIARAPYDLNLPMLLQQEFVPPA